DGTVVCYAGPEQRQQIVHDLLAHGRSPHDTAAVVYAGTLPTQETFVGTLATVATEPRLAGDSRAAVLVIGSVVGLRQHLQWFDARPLFGKRILVTRPRDQATELTEQLE